MIVTTSRMRVKYEDYTTDAQLQRAEDSMDRDMALGLYAFLFRENRDLDYRWVQLHRSFEFMAKDDDPGYLYIHGEVSLDLDPDEDGGDIE